MNKRIFKVIHPSFNLEGELPKRGSFLEFHEVEGQYKLEYPFNKKVIWAAEFLNKKIKDKDIKEMHFFSLIKVT